MPAPPKSRYGEIASHSGRLQVTFVSLHEKLDGLPEGGYGLVLRAPDAREARMNKWNGSRAKRLRQSIGATQRAVALLVPCSERQIAMWESTTEPGGRNLVAWAAALSRLAGEAGMPAVVVDDLMGGGHGEEARHA